MAIFFKYPFDVRQKQHSLTVKTQQKTPPQIHKTQQINTEGRYLPAVLNVAVEQAGCKEWVDVEDEEDLDTEQPRLLWQPLCKPATNKVPQCIATCSVEYMGGKKEFRRGMCRTVMPNNDTMLTKNTNNKKMASKNLHL